MKKEDNKEIKDAIKEVKLKVVEALQDDAYKGVARIDPQLMKGLGLNRGDVITIKGGRETAAIVDRAYPADVGEGIIRIDGLIRKNAKTGVGEQVSVKKAQVKPAIKVIIAPAQQGVIVQGDPEMIKAGLFGRVVSKGDILSLGGGRRRDVFSDPFANEFFSDFGELFPGFGLGGFQQLKFVVVSTNPGQACIINEQTELVLNSKGVDITEETGSVPDVTYEDIGGLTDEVKKIREMVELPLKHPEIFDKLGIEPPKGVLLHGPPGTGKTLLAKAVANESEAHFILLNGPEIMSKFYGECVTSDSLVFTNGNGLTTIQEAVKSGETHKITGINMLNQKAEFLPVSDSYDKGLQKTLKISTPHGIIELTPTSKLLVLNGIIPEWKFAENLKISDRVAVANALPDMQENIPDILNFVDDNVKFSGEWVKDLFNLNGKNKEISQRLGIDAKKIEGFKYNKSTSAKIVKSLYKKGFVESMKLAGKGKIPSKITKDLMYLLGLLSGDGHLRYNYRDGHVSTIQLTNIDENVISEFKRIVKETFGIEDIKYDGNYSYYFSSSPIGNLIKNMGIPVKNKSKSISVPNYLISMPKDFIAAYLKGLFDTDGHVHVVPSGMQVSYYTSSKQMMNGVKYLLLRLGIQCTFRYKEDGNYELTISDADSLSMFREKVGFNHKKRSANLSKEIKNKYSKPIYNRLNIKDLINEIKVKYNISNRKLIKLGLNPSVNGYDRKQLNNLIKLFKDFNDNELAEKISILAKNDIIWSPIKIIAESEGHVYDFTVPKDHNFIANGFVVHNSEKKIRDIFEDAEKNAPSIIFIDEIDAIAPKREDVQGEVERRVVSQLLTMMDGLKSRGKVVVIGATNRPNSLDSALRRPGRFDREVEISAPDKIGRLNILKIHTRNMPIISAIRKSYLENSYSSLKEEIKVLEFNFKSLVEAEKKKESLQKMANDKEQLEYIGKFIEQFTGDEKKDEKTFKSFPTRDQEKLWSILKEAMLKELAGKTHGFVGADIAALTKEAAMNVLRKLLPELRLEEEQPIPQEVLDKMIIRTDDFEYALKLVRPSAMREVLVEVPSVGWNDIGGLEKTKGSLKEAIEWPLKYSESFKRLGISPPRGILLYGPPGTGKTLLAKAVAKESEANFIQVKGPSLLSMWVGKSEEGVRKVFERARQVAPCVVFFDEIDSLAGRRGLEQGNKVTERVLNQLLAEVDGLEDLKDVTIIGATNRPDMLDPALLRPGRFDRVILVDIPDQESRKKIFEVHMKNTPIDSDVKIDDLVKQTEGYVGADIEGVVREASMTALRRDMEATSVSKKDFEEGLKRVKASVSPETAKLYKKMEEYYLKSAKAGIETGPLYAG